MPKWSHFEPRNYWNSNKLSSKICSALRSSVLPTWAKCTQCTALQGALCTVHFALCTAVQGGSWGGKLQNREHCALQTGWRTSPHLTSPHAIHCSALMHCSSALQCTGGLHSALQHCTAVHWRTAVHCGEQCTVE